MKLIQANWQPTRRQLRQFSGTCLVVLPVLGWLWGVSENVMIALTGGGLLIGLDGYALPKSVQPLYLTLMVITTPIGIVLGELAMLTIYFGLFWPMGLVFRLLRRDALQLQLDREQTTYWQPKPQPRNVPSYYRQF